MTTSDNNIQPTQRLTFHKSERLRHKSLVDSLFEKGETIYEWPLRMSWRKLSEKELDDSFKLNVPDLIGPLQLMITVPKRKRHRAVDRVRTRRLIREAYRLQRNPLKKEVIENPEIRTLSIAIIYMAPKNPDYNLVYGKMSILLEKLRKRLQTQQS